ncbi:hypothetical protein CKQ84_18825 [Shewanella sp. WE21]|jgi:hypothetical protein|uniref:hypothetical protein n=1 Tax=Shewanella sp. WE21 TaxID=2029986 RepID=UPI000CF72160|nr:hypothetical protein [Shewanella sp. WE21]AVI67734.1 hypothetical protein CKQ84_18825 [Shewanella sp. WE21]
MRIFGKTINSSIFSKSDKSHTSALPQWNKLKKETLKTVNSCKKNIDPFNKSGRVSINTAKIAPKQFLVHTVRDFENESPLLTQNAQTLLSSWDIISTSVVKTGEYSRSQWADVGLILAAEPQNIISTSRHDVRFQNHAGNEPGKPQNTYALTESYFKGQGMHGYTVEGGTYAKIETPSDIINNTFTGTHNEILVVGKPDIRTYEGYDGTEKVKVCGIYCHQMLGNNKENNELKYNENNELIDKLLKVNPGLTLFREFTWTGSITMKNQDKIKSYVNSFK